MEPVQSQKGLEDEETAPQAALPEATGFHPGLTQKNLMEENERPTSSLICCQPAAAGRLPKSCNDEAAPCGAVWEGITGLIPCSSEPEMTQTSQTAGPAREGDNERRRGFSPRGWCLLTPLMLWQTLDSVQPVR